MNGTSSSNDLSYRKLPVDERRARALKEYIREQHTERYLVGCVGAPPLKGEDRIYMRLVRSLWQHKDKSRW